MSLLKYIVILILLFSVGFLILGLNSGYNYTYKNKVLSSPGTAWQYSMDPSNWSSWDALIDTVLPLTDSTFEIHAYQEGSRKDIWHIVSSQRDSFSWKGEWLSRDWNRQIEFQFKPDNVLCSLYIVETLQGIGFLNRAKLAFSMGRFDHQRDMTYDSMCVQLKKFYLKQ